MKPFLFYGTPAWHQNERNQETPHIMIEAEPRALKFVNGSNERIKRQKKIMPVVNAAIWIGHIAQHNSQRGKLKAISQFQFIFE
jgi:hypothetical protein